MTAAANPAAVISNNTNNQANLNAAMVAAVTATPGVMPPVGVSSLKNHSIIQALSSPKEESITSVKERIMLFSTTNPNPTTTITPMITTPTTAASPRLISPRKLLKMPVVASAAQQQRVRSNDLLSNKFVHNHSSPSIGHPNLAYLKRVTNTNASNSFVTTSSGQQQSSSSSNLRELRKYSSTTALVQTVTNDSSSLVAAGAELVPSTAATIDEQETTTLMAAVVTTTRSSINRHQSEDDFEHFKSVKDKIAYFSSKAATKRVAALNKFANLNKAKSNSVLNSNGNDSHHHFNYKSNNNAQASLLSSACQAAERFPLANKIEIVTSNAMSRQLPKLNCQADDYDSLKHAYKLNALANSTSKLNKHTQD